MDLEKDAKKEKESCCADSSCCSSSQKEEQSAGNGDMSSQFRSEKDRLTSKIKTSIFVIVVLAAVGVAAMSVLKKNRVEQMVETENESKTNLASQQFFGSTLDSLISLNKVAVNKDFVFILLPGAKIEETEKVDSIIEQTSEIISQEGTRVATLTLKTDSPDYQKLVSYYKIDKFPAVLAMSKGCGTDIIMGKMTKEELLAVYLRSSKPVSCKPGSCYPK